MRGVSLKLPVIIAMILCAGLASCAKKEKARLKEAPGQAYERSGPAKEESKSADMEQAAQEVSDKWLALIDAGDYETSWDEAAEYFKGAITKENWASTLNAVRGPLGKMVHRTLMAKEYYTSLPGAPDGQYVVIQYEASYENKQHAIETVTPMKDKDGVWRVSGYFIK